MCNMCHAHEMVNLVVVARVVVVRVVVVMTTFVVYELMLLMPFLADQLPLLIIFFMGPTTYSYCFMW